MKPTFEMKKVAWHEKECLWRNGFGKETKAGFRIRVPTFKHTRHSSWISFPPGRSFFGILWPYLPPTSRHLFPSVVCTVSPTFLTVGHRTFNALFAVLDTEVDEERRVGLLEVTQMRLRKEEDILPHLAPFMTWLVCTLNKPDLSEREEEECMSDSLHLFHPLTLFTLRPFFAYVL